MSELWPQLALIILLACSNLFMTHHRLVPPSQVQVSPAHNRGAGELGDRICGVIGSAVYSPAELKTIQEVSTLIVFAGFTAIYFKEPLSLTRARALP